MQNDRDICQTCRTYHKQWIDTHWFLKTLEEKILVNWYIPKTVTICTCSKDKDGTETNTAVLRSLTSSTFCSVQ